VTDNKSPSHISKVFNTLGFHGIKILKQSLFEIENNSGTKGTVRNVFCKV